MKTFEITFTHNNSGIYFTNLCKAETAEQAQAYFQTLGNYEIIGVSETNTQPKPGQPVHIVPENWEAPEEQHPNIKEAAKKYEAETLATFADNLESKTAAEILASWHLKQYTTPKTLEALQNCKPNEKPAAEILAKMKAKKAREEAKATAKRFEKLEAAAQLDGQAVADMTRNPPPLLTLSTITPKLCGYCTITPKWANRSRMPSTPSPGCPLSMAVAVFPASVKYLKLAAMSGGRSAVGRALIATNSEERSKSNEYIPYQRAARRNGRDLRRTT